MTSTSRFACALAALALLAACGGKAELVPASAGVGGAGGGTSTTQSSSTSGDTSTSASGDASTSTGGATCATCADSVLHGSHDPICPSSQKVFDALLACVCDDACAMPCANDCYFGGDPPVYPECQTCMDAAISGDGSCAAAFQACAADK